jgi:uncharacterized protein YdhG (YjbR/CyaY superfamily)
MRNSVRLLFRYSLRRFPFVLVLSHFASISSALSRCSTDARTVICFFQAAKKFEARYATFGFNDAAKLDDGNMWPASFALTKLTAAEEKKIVELIKKAVR